MKNLITPKEVLEIAFSAYPAVEVTSITEQMIVTAQEKWIKPILNGLYHSIARGEYEELNHSYVKPALAEYIAFLALDELSIIIGQGGIAQFSPEGYGQIANKEKLRLRDAYRQRGFVMSKRLIDIIESEPDKYPEYDPKKNVMNRCTISSGVIMTE